MNILMAIKPEWCKKIICGEKTIEVRKTKPELLDKVPDEPKEEEPLRFHCAYCARDLETEWTYCPYCGTAVHWP